MSESVNGGDALQIKAKYVLRSFGKKYLKKVFVVCEPKPTLWSSLHLSRTECVPEIRVAI